VTAIIAAAAGITWHFLSSTPAGCYSKITAIGSSVCHQLPTHSFILNGVQFPLCARCTGLYLGALVGLVYAFLSGKKGGIPKTPYLILLGAIFVIWAADGMNSLISAILNRPFLWETTNLTRLITGYGMGLVMATALSTLFNATIWEDYEKKPVIHSPLQIGLYILASAGINLLVSSNHLVLFQAAGYLGIGTAVAIITLLYCVLWVIMFKKENTIVSLRGLWIFLVAGFGTAMLQITLLILLRSNLLGY